MSPFPKICVVLFLISILGVYFAPSTTPTSLPTAHAASFTAVQSGYWYYTTTWGGSVPTSADDVIIPEGIKVTIAWFGVKRDAGTTTTNDGELEIIGDYTWYRGLSENRGVFTNNGLLTIRSDHRFFNYETFHNYGEVDNWEPYSYHNYGTFYNYCGGTIPYYGINDNPVIEVGCPPTVTPTNDPLPSVTPTLTSMPSPVVMGCDSSDFPKYGLVMVTTQQMGYETPNGEPAHNSDGNTLWILWDADGDGDDTYVISAITRGTDGEVWLGLYMGGCDLVYVPLEKVTPMNWIPEP